MNRNEYRTEYLPALDGLRGLAILLVMGCHFFFKFGIFKGGWIGVDLFFVLSGYLITSKFIGQPVSFNLAKLFYRNRILRILPLYFAFIIFFIGIWYLLPEVKKALLNIPPVRLFWPQHFILLQNWMYVSGPTDGQMYNPLMHLWSIAIEDQFYLLFPLIILFITKVKHKLTLIIGVIILVALLRSFDFYLHPHPENKLHFYTNTFYRLDTFLSGILLAFLLRDFKNNKWLDKIFGLLLITSLGSYIFIVAYYNNLLADNPLITTAGYTVIATMFMSLIYFVVMQKSKFINKIFTSGFLVFSGKISYGLYIFHFPFDYFNYSLLHSYFKFLLAWGNEQVISVIFSLFLIGMVYLVSYTSYTYFERYFLKMKKNYARPVPVVSST